MEISEMKPIEMESLNKYDFLGDDDDSYALLLPGYYKGEALIREFHYNGGEHAVYVRNKHQCVVCDHVHPALREALKNTVDLYVIEEDTCREYMARVVVDDIDAIAEEAIRLHPYEYTLHPFPLMDGTFNIGDEECEFCEKKKGIYFKADLGPNRLFKRDTLLTENVEHEQVICPECILKEDIDMFPNMCDGIARHYRVENESEYRTNPPFFDRGKTTAFWPFHEGRSARYLGHLEPEDLIDDLRTRLEKNWKYCPTAWWNDFEPEEIWKAVEQGRLDAYLFKSRDNNELFPAFNEFKIAGRSR